MPEYYDSYRPAPQPPHYIVTQSARNIKALARQTLQGHWGEAILAAFIMEAIMSGPGLLLKSLSGSDFAVFLSDLYNIVISGPANVGLMMFFLGIFRMQDPEKRLIYSGLRYRTMFFRSLLVYCSMMMRIILWSFLLVIPGIIAAYKYSLSFKVLADHPDYTASECLSASARIMDGNKMKYFLLQLSFWFWALLAAAPRGFCAAQAMQNVPNLTVLLTDMSVFTNYMNEYLSNPVMLVSYALGVILNVYVQLAGCCFYDLAAGNLVVRQSQTGDESNGNY